jgi:2,4-dienoyl-CoA reductase-like NADH-dependent reductase (Old Yellow Enzyme family)
MVSGSNSETLQLRGHGHAVALLIRMRSTRIWRPPPGSVVKVPVILAGRVSTPEQAEDRLASGICDLVGMTRAMIADPEMPRKAGGRLGRHPHLRGRERRLHRPPAAGQVPSRACKTL